MWGRFKWTEEQLKAPITIGLERLSERTILGEILSFKEELEIAQKDKMLPAAEKIKDWVVREEALQEQLKEGQEEISKSICVMSEQEKQLYIWLKSIEELRKQMQQSEDALSKNLKERQGWKEILSKLKPISGTSQEVESIQQSFLDLTSTVVRVSKTEDGSAEPKPSSLPFSVSEKPTTDPKPEDGSAEPKPSSLPLSVSEKPMTDPKSVSCGFKKHFTSLDTPVFPRKSSERSISNCLETHKPVHSEKQNSSFSESPEGIFSSWSHTLPKESEQEALEIEDREEVRAKLEYKENKRRS